MNPLRTAVVAGAFLGTALTGGVAAAAMMNVSASAASTTAGTPTTTPAGTFDPTKGGHVANGITEVLLTGTTAAKAKAAALAAVPGATIQRVENDAEGAVYEAHMVKSDGSEVTVKLDANFKVIGIQAGMGGH